MDAEALRAKPEGGTLIFYISTTACVVEIRKLYTATCTATVVSTEKDPVDTAQRQPLLPGVTSAEKLHGLGGAERKARGGGNQLLRVLLWAGESAVSQCHPLNPKP